MKSAAFITKKGGAGKTTLAHLLCLGAAWRGVSAHMLHTDDREPIEANGRPYDLYDARGEDDLIYVYNKLQEADSGILAVDGGGNRPEFDKWIAETVDLVVIPTGLDPEDIKVALDHYENLSHYNDNVRFIINRYPGTVGRYDLELLSQLPEELVIGRLGAVKATRSLRDDDPEHGFQTPPTNVNNLARKLYTITESAFR
ncbi:MAG: hypothetical protein V7752_08705 [Halopseudomonas sp.]